MSVVFQPDSGLLYMKVGTHAQESLEEIIARKTKEIEEAGYALWGYGGNTCHPLSMVQPFAREFQRQGSTIYLCMQPMHSRHFALPERAKEFSVDGINWQEIPAAINVLGSRYALAIAELKQESLKLPLSKTRVAIGNSEGRLGSRYVDGRVDKACLRVVDDGSAQGDEERKDVDIGLVAKLVEPFAVFVRN